MLSRNPTPITLETAKLLGVTFKSDNRLFSQMVFRYRRAREGFVLQYSVEFREGNLFWFDTTADYFTNLMLEGSLYVVEIKEAKHVVKEPNSDRS